MEELKGMSNMIFLAFMALSWAGILQRLGLTERVFGIADGNIDGYRYSIIQKGNKLYILLPDYSPREKCREVAEKILKILSPEAEIKVVDIGYVSTYCNYCLESTSCPYRCHRCGGWYCQDHRLPEEHNCPGSGEAKAAVREVVKKRGRKKEKKEVIAVEVPCG